MTPYLTEYSIFLYEGVSVESNMPLPFVPHCGTENNTNNNKKTKQLRLRCHIVAIAHDWLSSYWCTCVHHMTIGWSWSGRVSGHWSEDTGGDGAGAAALPPVPWTLGDILDIVTQGETGLAAAPSPPGSLGDIMDTETQEETGLAAAPSPSGH